MNVTITLPKPGEKDFFIFSFPGINGETFVFYFHRMMVNGFQPISTRCILNCLVFLKQLFCLAPESIFISRKTVVCSIKESPGRKIKRKK